MTYRTAIHSTFEDYLVSTDETQQELEEQQSARHETLSNFPFSVMLQVAYPELDFVNRWCWQSFGPHQGECFQIRSGYKSSEYPACDLALPHSHIGTWRHRWLVKTDYDFGFCEWYFSNKADHVKFLAFVPSIHWGEKYPK